MRMDAKNHGCLLLFSEIKLWMLARVEEDIGENDWVLLRVVADLRGDGGVHGQRSDLLKHRHTLVLLNVTSWYRMDQHFHAYIFDTRLEARPVDIWNLNEIILIARDVVPSAVKRNRHVSILAFFESGARNHYFSMDVFFLLTANASVHQGKVE